MSQTPSLEAPPEVINIAISELPENLAPASQMRHELNTEAIARYKETFEDLPRPRIMEATDRDGFYLVDGTHTITAAKGLERTHIEVDLVGKGTYTDAFAAACLANQTHGLPITNADKNARVRHALRHPELASLSNRVLAATLGVSYEFVRQNKLELATVVRPARADELVAPNGKAVTRSVKKPGNAVATLEAGAKQASPLPISAARPEPRTPSRPDPAVVRDRVRRSLQQGPCSLDALGIDLVGLDPEAIDTNRMLVRAVFSVNGEFATESDGSLLALLPEHREQLSDDLTRATEEQLAGYLELDVADLPLLLRGELNAAGAPGPEGPMVDGAEPADSRATSEEMAATLGRGRAELECLLEAQFQKWPFHGACPFSTVLKEAADKYHVRETALVGVEPDLGEVLEDDEIAVESRNGVVVKFGPDGKLMEPEAVEDEEHIEITEDEELVEIAEVEVEVFYAEIEIAEDKEDEEEIEIVEDEVVFHDLHGVLAGDDSEEFAE